MFGKIKEVYKNAKAWKSLCKDCRKNIEEQIFKHGVRDVDKLSSLVCEHCKTKFDDV